MLGKTLKLLGQPTPLLVQELKVDKINKKAQNVTTDLNRFFLIIFPIYRKFNELGRKYIINKYY